KASPRSEIAPREPAWGPVGPPTRGGSGQRTRAAIPDPAPAALAVARHAFFRMRRGPGLPTPICAQIATIALHVHHRPKHQRRGLENSATVRPPSARRVVEVVRRS